MVNVNGMEMPMKKQSGLLALEDPSGQQTWAMITGATVEYGGGDVEFTADELPELKLSVVLPPGESLRYASSHEVDEENVLMYSRLLVALLREERARYAELEQELVRARRERAEAIERRDDALEARDADRHYAWQDGAVQGFIGRLQGRTPDEILQRNPHPTPDVVDDDDEEF